MRTKKFAAMIRVATYKGEVPAELREIVPEALTQKLSGDLKGPRGGRYVPIGDVAIFGPEMLGRDWEFGAVSYRATRMGRYVRPVRS